MSGAPLVVVTSFLSFMMFVEVPLQVFVAISILTIYLHESITPTKRNVYYPKVSFIVTCYSEGKDVVQTMDSLTGQIYRGIIEVLIIIDGAAVNKDTLEAAKNYAKTFTGSNRRVLRIMPKLLRGGLVSSRNTGLRFSTGEIVIAIDGDSSCDNDMVSNIVQTFYDKNVIATSGTLRVRNVGTNVLSKLQGLEYMLGIHLTRIALAKVNSINNVSGAFGAFRRDFMVKTHGWRNGTAEDLDRTLRMQSFFRKHKKLRVTHCPKSITHTDVPTTIKDLFKQRMRWDGDLYYMYIRRHRKRINPKYLVWKTFIITIISGLLMQAIIPMVISAGLIYSFIMFPLPFFVAILSVVYVYYLVILTIFYLIFIILVSELKKQDIKLCWVLLLMPIYNTIMKFVTSFAIISEIFLKTHKGSNMAPDWVNKKVN